MTRYDVDKMLSEVLDTLPKFGITLESEFAINWREQKIMFWGKYYWEFSVFNKDGSEIQKISDINELAKNSDPYYKINNCDSLVIRWIDEEVNEVGLDVGLRDIKKLNVEKIRSYILMAKEKVLEYNIEYWSDYRKMHEWNMKALQHTRILREKLMEYESAAMEPDMNIIAYIRKEINAEMDAFCKLYDEHFK